MENHTNPNCTLYCENKIDDLKHASTECPWTKDKIKIIFTNLDPDKVWVGNTCSTKLLFGVYDKSINNIILIKQYLLKVRSGQCIFSLKSFKREIYHRIISDKEYSTVSNFESKWSAHSSLVTESVQYSMY